MPYMLKLFGYTLIAGLPLCAIVFVWLHKFALAVAFGAALVYAYPAILLGRWLFGGKNL